MKVLCRHLENSTVVPYHVDVGRLCQKMTDKAHFVGNFVP